MEWWHGFWGWALTTGLAAAGAAGVVIEEVRRHRNQPRARLWCERVGTLTMAEGPKYRVFLLSNSGTADAALLRVLVKGAERQFPNGDEFGPSSILRASSETKIAILDADLTRAYVVIIWAHPSDSTLHLQWLVLDINGPLAEELDRQHAHWRTRRSRLRRLLPGRQRHVGPGGVPIARIRRGQPRRLQEALAAPAEPGLAPSPSSQQHPDTTPASP